MKSKFTPGPWQFNYNPVTTALEARVIPADWKEAAKRKAICNFPDPTFSEGWSQSEVLANAALISAAPELLEALERVMKAFAPSGVEGLTSTQKGVIGNVMNAIAKARGESV